MRLGGAEDHARSRANMSDSRLFGGGIQEHAVLLVGVDQRALAILEGGRLLHVHSLRDDQPLDLRTTQSRSNHSRKPRSHPMVWSEARW
eukprot:1207535-Rhodomonas_salina.4